MLMYAESENANLSLPGLLLEMIKRNVEMNRTELEDIIMYDFSPGTRILLDYLIKFGIVEYNAQLNIVRLGAAMEILSEE